MEQYTTIEGDTVDLIAYRRFGTTKGATEAILRANQGLAAAGTVLPAGLTISIPAFVATKEPATVRIWS